MTSASVRHDPPGEMLIAATRTDGLGGRLMAMVNAKSLADALGYRFGFTWNGEAVVDNTFHIVDVVEKIFSADFIGKYWLGEHIESSRFGTLDRSAFSRASLDATARQRKLQGWICNENEADILECLHDPGDTPIRRSETLRAFGFSTAVKQALEAADGCSLPGPTAALHLRSGDIVYGRYRTSLIFADKVVPSTLVRAIVSRLSSMGLATLLVGQDRPTLDYLKSETGALLCDDLGAGEFEDQTLRSFFEIALMARCRRIYAGNSVFARLSSVMGEAPLLETSALFGRAEAAEIILDELRDRQSDYHPHDAAFGYQAAFLNLEDDISPARARDILAKAYALDEENDAYPLKMVTAYFRQGDYPAGEAMLKSLMTRQFQAGAKLPLPVMRVLARRAWGRLVMARDFELFFAAARAGYPYAAICSAHILHAGLGKMRPALKMAALSLKAEPKNMLFRKIKRLIQPLTTPESGPLSKMRLRLWKAGIRI